LHCKNKDSLITAYDFIKKSSFTGGLFFILNCTGVRKGAGFFFEPGRITTMTLPLRRTCKGLVIRRHFHFSFSNILSTKNLLRCTAAGFYANFCG